jgi:hypothetical protein
MKAPLKNSLEFRLQAVWHPESRAGMPDRLKAELQTRFSTVPQKERFEI